MISSTIHPKRVYTRDPSKEVDKLVDRRDAATSTAARNAYEDILTYFAEYDYDYEKTATRLKLEAGYLIARRKQDKGYVDELVRENWLVCIHIYRQWYRRFIGD